MTQQDIPGRVDHTILTYDSDLAQMNHFSGIDELALYRDDSKISWININGLQDIDTIKRLGELFNIHPLTIEDILHTYQQPKIEIFEDYSFFLVKTIQREKKFYHKWEKKKKRQDEKIDEFLIDQISILIVKNVIITFQEMAFQEMTSQEMAGDTFDIVRKKIFKNTGEIRKKGIDYLAYSIIDAIVDEYFLTLNHLEEDIEDFEERATKTSDSTFIQELQDTKKYLLQIKRAILPVNDNMSMIIHHEMLFQTDELRPFLQDLKDHLNNAITRVENYREWLSNIMDVNLSMVSHQMNKVMKVLAIISTIFIPLTFIAGVYGMNFEFMPELRHEWGYPVVLSGMGIIAAIMVLIFKIHHWF